MILIDDLLKEKQKELQQLIAKIEKNRKNHLNLKGGLRVTQNRKHYSYYHFLSEEKEKFPQGQYIPKNKMAMAQELAQRDYDEAVLAWAKASCVKLEKLMEIYQDKRCGEFYDTMIPGRKVLVSPYEVLDDDFAKTWQEIPFEGKKILDGNAGFITEKNEIVRSKSEKILADLFNRFGIPYKYESPVFLEGYGQVYPDFTLLNKRTRKEWYWEHLGMMDNPEYAQKAIMKIHSYEQTGILPGKQLILTFEAKNNFNFKEAQILITEYLI